MGDDNNGGRLTDSILGRLKSIDDKMDTLIANDATNRERLKGHGLAIKWLYGIMGGLVLMLLAVYVGAK